MLGAKIWIDLSLADGFLMRNLDTGPSQIFLEKERMICLKCMNGDPIFFFILASNTSTLVDVSNYIGSFHVNKEGLPLSTHTIEYQNLTSISSRLGAKRV